jgi:hypothetical protein
LLSQETILCISTGEKREIDGGDAKLEGRRLGLLAEVKGDSEGVFIGDSEDAGGDLTVV